MIALFVNAHLHGVCPLLAAGTVVVLVLVARNMRSQPAMRHSENARRLDTEIAGAESDLFDERISQQAELTRMKQGQA